VATLFEITTTFMKVGGFTLGGGYAMLPMIEREVIDRKKWIERQEVLDIYALAQSVPGAIAINSAMFIGYRLRGLLGAIFAGIGMITPSLLVILIIAQGFSKVQDNRMVISIMQGARAGVVALIVFVTWSIAKRSIKGRVDLTIGLAALVAVTFDLVSAVGVLLISALLGIVAYRLQDKKAGPQDD